MFSMLKIVATVLALCILILPGPISVRNEKFKDLPDDVSVEAEYQSPFSASRLMFSPDEQWIVYTNLFEKNYPIFYYRHRSWVNSYTTVIINHNLLESITSMSFTAKGDRLLVGSDFGYLYVCSFNQFMTASDCEPYVMRSKEDVDCMDVSGKNKIGFMSGNMLTVLSINRANQIVFEFSQEVNYSFVEQIEWHPKDTEIILLIGSKLITVFNTTSKTSNQITITKGKALKTSPNGDIVYVVANLELHAYLYSKGNLTFLGVVQTDQPYDNFYDLHLSLSATLLISKQQIHIKIYQILYPSFYYLNQTNLESILPYSSSQALDITLKLLYSIHSDQSSSYTPSQDLNSILFSTQSHPITIFSICPPTTYISGLNCLQCSKNCSSCHLTNDLCLTCPNNTYTLDNGVCYDCYKKITGCMTCLNTTYCLTCNTTSNYEQNSTDGTCLCQQFFFNSSNSCVQCDSMQICKRCSSLEKCLMCNTDLKWKQSPVNGICVCQEFYYFQDLKCLACDSYGACKQCKGKENCTVCDVSQGYNEKAQRGECQCRKQFSEVNHKCIQCFVDGCIWCSNANACKQCSQIDGYDPNPNNLGGCQKKSNFTSLIMGVSIGTVVLIVVLGIIGYRKFKHRKQAEEIEEEQPRRFSKDLGPQEPQKIVEPLLDDDREKVKYSDEERIRLQKLQSLLSN